MFLKNGNIDQKKIFDHLKQQNWFKEWCESKPNEESAIINECTGEIIKMDKYGRTPNNPNYMNNKCPW